MDGGEPGPDRRQQAAAPGLVLIPTTRVARWVALARSAAARALSRDTRLS
jgi:hypothetical protein